MSMQDVATGQPGQQAAVLLRSLRSRKVRLWADGAQLRYSAPEGALRPEDLMALGLCKPQVMALLKRPRADAGPPLGPRKRGARVPLTFSQLMHWHSLRLGERHTTRAAASVIRLTGQLNSEVLGASFEEVVRRHEALRTQIVVSGSTPIQQVLEHSSCKLHLEDLTSVAEEERETALSRVIEVHLSAPVNAAVDPLLAVTLVRMREGEHVLIVAMEHVISDAVSMNIFHRDLFATYDALLKGERPALTPVLVQFPDYAVWQQSAYRLWNRTHGPAWNRKLTGCPCVRFLPDVQPGTTTETGWATASVHIDAEMKARLLDWCRRKRTTPAMAAFTAYAAVVLRWCGMSEAVFLYQTTGRLDPRLENTIGFFSSVLYLRIRLSGEDTLLDLLQRVTAEYRSAYEPRDFAHMATQVPRPEFARSTCFNWIPGTQSTQQLGSSLQSSPVPFTHPILKHPDMDSEPWIGLIDADDGIRGGVHFPVNRFTRAGMERFASQFQLFVDALLDTPDARVPDI